MLQVRLGGQAEGAVAIFVGLGPVSTEPIRPVPARKHLALDEGFVNFKGVGAAGCQNRVWFLEGKEVWLEKGK